MLFIFQGGENFSHTPALCAMFEARKLTFVDQLGWDLPIVADRYEVDQFDDQAAEYLVIVDANGRHMASARLLRTDRPHLLGTLFAYLTRESIPHGPRVREITRFCLDPRLAKEERMAARNQLVSAIADYAIANEINAYTGVAEMPWLEKILNFGWDCTLLERPISECERVNSQLRALHIRIDENTISKLQQTGIYWSHSHAQTHDLESVI